MIQRERINNAFIRQGHNVLSLSDRDLISFSKSLRDPSGSNYLNTLISKTVDNFKPDLLVLNSQSFCEDKIIEDSRLPYHVKSFYLENENDLFLTDTISDLTYVCSILVRKSLWVANFNRTKIGSAFAHIDCVASISFLFFMMHLYSSSGPR